MIANGKSFLFYFICLNMLSLYFCDEEFHKLYRVYQGVLSKNESVCLVVKSLESDQIIFNIIQNVPVAKIWQISDLQNFVACSETSVWLSLDIFMSATSTMSSEVFRFRRKNLILFGPDESLADISEQLDDLDLNLSSDLYFIRIENNLKITLTEVYKSLPGDLR